MDAVVAAVVETPPAFAELVVTELIRAEPKRLRRAAATSVRVIFGRAEAEQRARLHVRRFTRVQADDLWRALHRLKRVVARPTTDLHDLTLRPRLNACAVIAVEHQLKLIEDRSRLPALRVFAHEGREVDAVL